MWVGVEKKLGGKFRSSCTAEEEAKFLGLIEIAWVEREEVTWGYFASYFGDDFREGRR